MTYKPSSNTSDDPDRVVFRPELMQRLGVSTETIRRYLKNNKLPTPDVALSQKKQGWRVSTLRASGIGIV